MSSSSEQHSESGTPSEPLRITNARELRAALFAPDPGTRLQVLKGIGGQPTQALAFGLLEGRDVIDLLLERAARTVGRPEWQAVAAALCAFRDPRVTSFMVEVLRTASDADQLFLAAYGLRDVDLEPLRDELLPLLLQNDSMARARALAPVLARDPCAGIAAQVRLALLADTDEPPAPPLDASSEAVWLGELSGPLYQAARAELELQGHAAFVRLGFHWEALSSDSHAWLVAWGVWEFADLAFPTIEKALGSQSTAVALSALEEIASYSARVDARSEWLSPLRASLAALLDHSRPQLRLAAITALGRVPSVPGESRDDEGIDWRARIAHEEDPMVRRACTERLAVSEGAAAVGDLLALLRDADWRPRSAAVDALIGLGESILPRVEPLLEDEEPAVRAGAAKIWLSLSPD